ncbi:MAG TPA: chemotaxis protein CheW [Polyangia bacterium]|jgi:purine-binding chemotaxis protein CheW|nr:chemotaxis protein CheW [Polyangia bacterium]
MSASPHDDGGNGENRRALALRREFDDSFARPARSRVADVERLLQLRCGADGYAFRLRDIGGLTAARKIVPIASAIPEVLGLAGVRGNLVPVYSLAALLGYGLENEAPRWFVSVRDVEPIAFGFAQFDGYAELQTSAVHAGKAPRAHVQALAHVQRETGQQTIAVLDVASLVGTIRERAQER